MKSRYKQHVYAKSRIIQTTFTYSSKALQPICTKDTRVIAERAVCRNGRTCCSDIQPALPYLCCSKCLWASSRYIVSPFCSTTGRKKKWFLWRMDPELMDWLWFVMVLRQTGIVPLKCERRFLDLGNALEESRKWRQHIYETGSAHIDWWLVAFFYL